MKPQILTTTSGEELIVLTRREYDVLLARLGDEDAEDRMTVRLVDEARAELEAGTTLLLPVWFSDGIIARRNPVTIVREHFTKSLAETARAAGIAEDRLRGIEASEETPSASVLDAISESVDIDPRILRGMYEEPDRAA